ncbi:hypothetical protein AB1N83_002515 [Pleurotus pulmonarius]
MVLGTLRPLLKFIFKMIIVPHPKIVVPPSHPDLLFRFPAREGAQWASPTTASLLTPYSRRTTPRRPLSTSHFTDTVSPCRGGIQGREIAFLKIEKASGVSPHGRSLRRIKGTVPQMVHNQDGDHTTVPSISVCGVRCAENGGTRSAGVSYVAITNPGMNLLAILGSFVFQSTPVLEASPYQVDVATSDGTTISPPDVPSLVLTMRNPVSAFLRLRQLPQFPLLLSHCCGTSSSGLSCFSVPRTGSLCSSTLLDEQAILPAHKLLAEINSLWKPLTINPRPLFRQRFLSFGNTFDHPVTSANRYAVVRRQLWRLPTSRLKSTFL